MCFQVGSNVQIKEVLDWSFIRQRSSGYCCTMESALPSLPNVRYLGGVIRLFLMHPTSQSRSMLIKQRFIRFDAPIKWLRQNVSNKACYKSIKQPHAGSKIEAHPVGFLCFGNIVWISPSISKVGSRQHLLAPITGVIHHSDRKAVFVLPCISWALIKSLKRRSHLGPVIQYI